MQNMPLGRELVRPSVCRSEKGTALSGPLQHGKQPLLLQCSHIKKEEKLDSLSAETRASVHFIREASLNIRPRFPFQIHLSDGNLCAAPEASGFWPRAAELGIATQAADDMPVNFFLCGSPTSIQNSLQVIRPFHPNSHYTTD